MTTRKVPREHPAEAEARKAELANEAIAAWETNIDGMRGAEGASIVGDPPHGYPVNRTAEGYDVCPVCGDTFLPADLPAHMATHLGPPAGANTAPWRGGPAEGDVAPELAPAEPDPEGLGRVAVPVPGGGTLWMPAEFANQIEFIELPLPDPVAEIEAMFARYDRELKSLREQRDALNKRIAEIVKLHARLKSANATVRKP